MTDPRSFHRAHLARDALSLTVCGLIAARVSHRTAWNNGAGHAATVAPAADAYCGHGTIAGSA
jgi:hypothetical protein